MGPCFFLIYINDITSEIESIIKLFADDTSVYLGLENTHIQAEILNSDLEKLSQWALAWKDKFIENKTELVTISNQANPNTQPLTFNGVILQETDLQSLRGRGVRAAGS